MESPAVRLDREQRQLIERAVAEVCSFRGWQLVIVNCRKNHVHVVAKCGDIDSKTVMNQLKAYGTRALRKAGWPLERRVWTRDGSRRHVNSEESLAAAYRYVKHQ